jgi:DNA-binding response OmpR family regulator
LIIDDEPEYRSVLKDFLELSGYCIDEAENGEDALQQLDRKLPNLIISDINMPVMSGERLYEKIQEGVCAESTIPFVFLSGNIDNTKSIQWLNQGVYFCLQKPVDLEYLAALINSIFENAGRTHKFVEKQFDKVVSAFPELRLHYPSTSNNLLELIEEFTSVLATGIKDLYFNNKNIIATPDSHAKSSQLDEYQVLRLYSEEYRKRQSMVVTQPLETLTWDLILLVAETDFSDNKISVSDLYISFHAAKSTVNERINSLVLDGVFQKSNHPVDKRRSMVSLTGVFKTALKQHIKSNIKMIESLNIPA